VPLLEMQKVGASEREQKKKKKKKKKGRAKQRKKRIHQQPLLQESNKHSIQQHTCN
jgi:hypothetical protein